MRSARRLRATPTPAEVALWQLIYPFRTGDFHFRKQSPIGPYTVDFVCHAAKLVIEVDGDSHYTDDGIAKDKRRDAFLVKNGFRLLRFTNTDVLTNPDGVFWSIGQALRSEITPS